MAKGGDWVVSPIDDHVVPHTLEARTLEAVAKLIKDGKAKNIIAMTGAGISTAAGIPDFRSPETGLYNNLQRLNLERPEDVFDIGFFRENPKPFYVLAKELYPGQFHPTVSHAFLALLQRKGLLRMLFTQNIDCLERAAGVTDDHIVEAHGSFAVQRCIDCHHPFPDDAMREHVRDARVPRCRQPGCGGLVKPDIVFFGENLPERFHRLRLLPATDADLVLVMGTSLTVYPFAGLPTLPPSGVPRVLFNLEPVGDLGHRTDDVLALNTCDAGVRRLAAALGWADELESFWRDIVGSAEAARQRGEDVLLEAEPSKHGAGTGADATESGKEKTRHAEAEAEVQDIANKIEAVLHIDEDKEDDKDATTKKESDKEPKKEEGKEKHEERTDKKNDSGTPEGTITKEVPVSADKPKSEAPKASKASDAPAETPTDKKPQL